MAAKKKKKSTKAAKKKTPAKKTPAKKTKAPAKKPSKKTGRKSVKKAVKTAKKTKRNAPGLLARAIKAVTKVVTPAKKKAPAKKTIGEGDYQASRTFLKDQAGFVKKNKAKIPEMAKQAEKDLDGPEGDELRAAEEAGRSHSVAGKEE